MADRSPDFDLAPHQQHHQWLRSHWCDSQFERAAAAPGKLLAANSSPGEAVKLVSTSTGSVGMTAAAPSEEMR
jgi:hypothetical protein